MKFSIFTLLLLFIISSSLFAQFESIDLNKYKLTDFKYKSLSTGLYTDSKNVYANSNYPSGSSYSKDNSNQNSINSGGNLGYSSTTFNRKYVGNQSIGFSFNANLDNNFSKNFFNDYYDMYDRTNKSTSHTSGLASTLNINSNNRFYFSNKYFIGFNFQTSQQPFHSYSKSELNATTNTSTQTRNSGQTFNNYNSLNSVTIEFGKGRYENVTDARLAIYILDDLLKQGRLSHVPSEDVVLEFSDLITKTLNKRVIDDRIKQIKEYVAIDSFLVSKNLSTKTDGLYFGLINDNWNYARTQNWETGSAWYFGISPSLNYQNNFSKRIDSTSISRVRNKLSQYGISFNIGYGSSWITGLKWQKGYQIYGAFNYFKYDSSGYISKINNHKIIRGNANYFISYLPNTRTSIKCSGGMTLVKYLYKSTDTHNEIQIEPYIIGSCNYYFSEKLRFQIDANVNYNYNKIYDDINTSKKINFGIGFALQYYIF